VGSRFALPRRQRIERRRRHRGSSNAGVSAIVADALAWVWKRWCVALADHGSHQMSA